jgi:hypothetical protein
MIYKANTFTKIITYHLLSSMAFISLIPLQSAFAQNPTVQCMKEAMRNGISEANAAVACQNSHRPSRNMALSPTMGPTKMGRWYVYNKPDFISDDQMERAGAQFRPSPQLCATSYELCTDLDGAWLSRKNRLMIEEY